MTTTNGIWDATQWTADVARTDITFHKPIQYLPNLRCVIRFLRFPRFSELLGNSKLQRLPQNFFQLILTKRWHGHGNLVCLSAHSYASLTFPTSHQSVRPGCLLGRSSALTRIAGKAILKASQFNLRAGAVINANRALGWECPQPQGYNHNYYAGPSRNPRLHGRFLLQEPWR